MQGFFLLAFILQPPWGSPLRPFHILKLNLDEERSGDVISLSGNMADESDH
jgi:hypothetical protein